MIEDKINPGMAVAAVTANLSYQSILSKLQAAGLAGCQASVESCRRQLMQG